MNDELKKIVGRVKSAQTQLEALLRDKTWIEEARKYATRQSKEVKKLLSADVTKVRTFLERERKELENFQKQIPGEVKKLKKFVDDQKVELEKLLGRVRAVKDDAPKVKPAKAASRKKKPAKSAPARS